MQFNANELNIEKAKSDKENNIPSDLSWPPLYQDKSMITFDMAAYLLVIFFFFFSFLIYNITILKNKQTTENNKENNNKELECY